MAHGGGAGGGPTVSEAEVKNFKAIFLRADGDGDGFVTGASIMVRVCACCACVIRVARL